jgi:hypothetical protein
MKQSVVGHPHSSITNLIIIVSMQHMTASKCPELK